MARADTPEAFLRRGRAASTRRLVVCLGDSITQGQVSADYVRRLRARLGAEAEVLNAGVNGDLAFNVAKRLDAAIACRPDVVTLLVGTNDVNARFDPTVEARYRKNQGLSAPPTREAWLGAVEHILDRLRAETTARVVLVEIPPLGEDLDGRMNQLVREYNTSLRALAAERGLPCLPLYDRLVALFPPGHTPPPYAGELGAIVWAAASAMVLRRSWDEISRRNGLAVLTDHIHLNDRAAEVVAELLAAAIRGPEA